MRGGGFWGGGSELPSHQLRGGLGLGLRCKLPQWGPGKSHGCKRILVYFEFKNRIWRQLFRLFISAEKVEMVHFDAF